MEKITIKGRLGTDPELQTTQSGTKILTFPIAAEKNVYTKTKWQRVVICLDHKIKELHPFLKKGKYIELKGTFDYNTYLDKWGKQHKKEIILIEDNTDNISFPIKQLYSVPEYFIN